MANVISAIFINFTCSKNGGAELGTRKNGDFAGENGLRLHYV